MANKASEGAVGADASMSGAQLPMEVWRQVALRMSTHEMAKGLVQTCKSLRHLSTSAVCLSSGSVDAIKWARRCWVLATKLCLKPSKVTDFSLMSWVAFNCKELSPVSQLDIITNAHIADRRQPAAAAVAAMTAILTHQADNITMLNLDMWEIPQLPYMQNLKHLTVALSVSTTSDFMWTCLGHLSELRTLDLKLLTVESSDVKRLVDLSELRKVERLRLVHVTPSALLVRPQCKIAVKHVAKWPMFVLHWDRLQKLDLTAEEIGTASKRLSMAPLGHIRVVRLKSERGLTLWVPKQASWGYLSLECKLTMDLDFEDISTFGKTLIELRLIFGGFHGGKLGSDVLLSLNLMKQGFKRVQDSYSVQKKRKCLIIRRRKYKPPAQSVHDTCICGACVVCLKKAGIMHDHFPGKNPAASDPSPVLSGSAAAGVYPYDRSYERVDHLDDDLGGHDVYECDCYHCTAQREAEEEEDEEDDYEEEDENELAYYYHRRGY